MTPPLYFAVQNTEEEVECFLSYRQKLHDKRMSQNSSLPCPVALRGVPKEIGGAHARGGGPYSQKSYILSFLTTLLVATAPPFLSYMAPQHR